MGNIKTVSTSIKVPVEKYKVLEEIKKATGESIQDLIVESIDLLILDKAKEALEEVNERKVIIEKVISNIKEGKK